jgi:hypothetical protein
MSEKDLRTFVQSEDLQDIFDARAEKHGLVLDESAKQALASAFVNISANVLCRAQAHLRAPKKLEGMTQEPGAVQIVRSGEILSAIAPLHVRSGLRTLHEHSYQGCYVLPAKGNGACCFISLRLTVEVEEAMRCAHRLLDDVEGIEESLSIDLPQLSGHNDTIVAEGAYVRKCIVEWYLAKTHLEVPEMGLFTEGGKTWTRGDILDMEMIRMGKDLPQRAEDRFDLRQAYLNNMLRENVWGSVPEWVAFSMIRKRTVITYQWDSSTTRLREVDRGGKCFLRPPLFDPACVEAQWPPAPIEKLPTPMFSSSKLCDANDDDLTAFTDDDAMFEDFEIDIALESDDALDLDLEAEAGADTSAAVDVKTSALSFSEDIVEANAGADAETSAEINEFNPKNGSPTTKSEPTWQPVARLLFSGSHYDCLITAEEYFCLRAAFGPSAVASAVPLPQYIGSRPIKPM